MNHGKLIFFFDVDGTLFDHFTGMAQSTADTLWKLKKDGHLICLNTGRAAWFIPGCVMDFPFDGIVAGNGTYVEYQGRPLQDIRFASPFIHYVYEDFTSNKIPFTLESSKSNYMNAAMASHTRKRFARKRGIDEHSQALRFQPGSLEIKDTMSKDAAGQPIHKVSFYATQETLPYIKQLLGRHVTLTLEPEDAFGYLYGEAIPAGCCKSNGAALLSGYAGIPFGRTVAVGDGSNDVDMIQWAGIGIAMGNSDDSLKSVADYVCLPFQDGGIANIPDILAALPQ